MKNVSSLISTGTAALCLLLGIWLFVLGGKSQGLQSELQKLQQEVQNQQQILQTKQQQLQLQQEQINAGNTISQQVGPALLQDMASLSLKNEKLKNLLAKHGYNVEVKADKSKTEAP
jgi:hypothetical protein